MKFPRKSPVRREYQHLPVDWACKGDFRNGGEGSRESGNDLRDKKITGQWGEGFSGTTIKDTWTKPRGGVEAREGGGDSWGRGVRG